MCTYNITVDENVLAQRYPNVGREKFGELLQKWVDDMMSDDTPVAASRVSPNAHTYEEMKKYGVFNSYGFVCGVKEDAPNDFKEAYEEYKEHSKKMEDLGLD